MAGQHRADDDIAFYAADLGLTRRIAVTTIPAQLKDEDGPLEPGRYVLFIDDLSPSGKQKVWVRTGAFKAGVVLPVVAGLPWFPFSLTGIVFLELHIRKGFSDQIAAVASLGTANLYITKISNDA